MLRSTLRLRSGFLAVAAVWAFGPLLALLIYLRMHGGVFTGVNGIDYIDQFQYLAWIRDAGSHLLASNLWVPGATPHDYLNPMYLISGALWRIGLPIQAAYLIWKPVAVVALVLGFASYVGRFMPAAGERRAALFLALFYITPALALAKVVGVLSSGRRAALALGINDPSPVLQLWGFDQTAIAIGLMPVFLIAAERLLAVQSLRTPEGRRWTTAAAGTGLVVSWLHPWQGGILLAIVAGLLVCRPSRRRLFVLAAPVVATVLPLLYGFVLSRADPSWRFFDHRVAALSLPPWWALVVSLGPLVAAAALGVQRPRNDGEWMLLLWVAAAGAMYLLLPEFPLHVLSGLTLPLSVLAVRGWDRGRRLAGASQRVAVSGGVLALALFTVPGALDQINGLRAGLSSGAVGAYSRQLFRLTPDQAAALRYLVDSRRPGAVLAAPLLSLSIPELTGRRVYAGHPQWQPAANWAVARIFFDPAVADPTGGLRRAVLQRTGAAFVIGDCDAPAALGRALAPVTLALRRFGCVTVYSTRTR